MSSFDDTHPLGTVSIHKTPLYKTRNLFTTKKLRPTQEGAYEEAFTEACFKTYLVTLRVKTEVVQDERRLKSTIQRMTEIDIRTECEALLNAIDMYH